MKDKYPFKIGDHKVECDICGSTKYRSECKYTWDGFLACITNNCWYPKDQLFMLRPVINDPHTLQDIRPDRIPANYKSAPFPDPRTNWGTFSDLVNPNNTPPLWGSTNQNWGNFNPPYIWINH